MLQMILIIRGKVQRVGFRYSVMQFVQEQGLQIVGHVKNMPDGSVHVLAQGDIEALKLLHRFCTKGPTHAQVREVEQDLHPIHKVDYNTFEVVSD
jgi:acylphosphatase